MRLRKYEFALRYLSLLLLPTLSCTMNLDCKNIRDNKQSFDVSALGNPISVMTSQNHFPSPTMTNTTFTMDICKPLNKAKGIAKEEDCPNGSRGMALPHFLDDSGSASSKSYRLRLYGHAVCGIEMLINTYENITVLQGAIPIAGQYTLHHGVELDPKITRFKTSSSASDREKEGFRLELHGLKYPADNGLKQKAIIEFLCQNKAEGKGSEERNLLSTTDERRAIEEDIVVKTDGDDDGEEDHSATGEVADDGHGGTLRRNIFLGTAAYLIFGSWLNYNRYSARGWDLVPHSETIRDIPYIFKDWMRRVLSTIQGGGSRGGYSAV
ncbi:MAG: hypothetical protein L6R41_007159 [Letrouitia leprolyta]|nr:MAG: hypothetical protein L6R41_007159 [Letrouitia leprolyta]